jgi:hypothetical protein
MTTAVLRSHLVSLLLAAVTPGCESRDVVAASADAGSCGQSCVCESLGPARYMFCAGPASWEAAGTACAEQGMTLARIDSDEENTWIRATADANALSLLWIGSSDLAEEGVWRWPDGELVLSVAGGVDPPGYHAFPEPEPNRGRGSNCGMMYESASWHDQPCDYERSFVCRG